MKRILLLSCMFLLGGALPSQTSAPRLTVEQLQSEFEQRTGARLVFERSQLPPGNYHDLMPNLESARQVRAAQIMLEESRKLPAGYFKAIGLRCVGVFNSCASRAGDGYRPYNEAQGGYRYFGIWNGRDAIACAFYTESQLVLTFHHESFHQVDATRRGQTSAERLSQDLQFPKIQQGEVVHQALALSRADQKALEQKARGQVLQGAVSAYAGKNPGEDKAETARHLMTNLADSLLQAATRPQLPGSQRLLHVLACYAEATPEAGPGVDWFVAVALNRPVAAAAAARKPEPEKRANPYLKRVDEAISDLEWRAVLCQVQPACVRLGGASGVNIDPRGILLTNAHVARQRDNVLTAEFPDGRSFQATCIAIDAHLDLALCRFNSPVPMPFARLAEAPPAVGARVACIGNPGSTTPRGEKTNYQPFHVSVGSIRGYNGDPLGNQELGRLMHDAWTYWGHSGSPLFDHAGRIVGLHNSWDSKNAMRHGVPLQALQEFLRDKHVGERGK